MKGNILIVFCFLAFLCSCKKTPHSDKDILITLNEEQKKTTVLLSEIAKKIEVIPLEKSDSILFGEIEQIKASNDYLVLFDKKQTKSLIFFNHKGEFVNQLRKVGQGPDEYVEILSFSLDTKQKNAYIYDRNSNNFIVYSLPNLEFRKKIKTGQYLRSVDFFGNSCLAVSDEDLTKETEAGVGFLNVDLANESVKFNPIKEFPNKNIIVENSLPNTISPNKNGLLYAMPSQYPKIYQITDKEVTLIATVDFGKNKIPKKYWEKTKIVDFEDAFFVSPLKSDWVQNVIVTDDIITFYYMFANPDNRQIAIYDKKTQQTSVIYKIRMAEKCGVLPYALGVHQDSFMTLLYPDDLAELFPNGISENCPQWVKDIEKSLKAEKVVCLKYKIK